MTNELIVYNWSLDKALDEKRKIDENLSSQSPESLKIESSLWINHYCSNKFYNCGRYVGSDHQFDANKFILRKHDRFPDYLVNRISITNEDLESRDSNKISQEIDHKGFIEDLVKKNFIGHDLSDALRYILGFDPNSGNRYQRLFNGHDSTVALSEMISKDCLDVIAKNINCNMPFPKISLENVANYLCGSMYYSGDDVSLGIGGIELNFDEQHVKKIAQQYLSEGLSNLEKDLQFQRILNAGIIDRNQGLKESQKKAIYKVLTNMV